MKPTDKARRLCRHCCVEAPGGSAQRRHQSQGQSSSPTPASPWWAAPGDRQELLLDLPPSPLRLRRTRTGSPRLPLSLLLQLEGAGAWAEDQGLPLWTQIKLSDLNSFSLQNVLGGGGEAGRTDIGVPADVAPREGQLHIPTNFSEVSEICHG